MEDSFPLRLRSSTLGGGGVILEGLKTSSSLADLQRQIHQKSLIPAADQKSTLEPPNPNIPMTKLSFLGVSRGLIRVRILISYFSVLFGFPPRELNVQDATATLATSQLTKNDVLIVSSRSGQSPVPTFASNSTISTVAAAFRPDSAAAFAARKAQESRESSSNSNSRKRKEPTPSDGFGAQVRTLSDIKPRLLPGHRINEDGDEEIVVAKRRKTKPEKPLPALPGLKIMGFIVNCLPNGWYTVDSWLEPPHIMQFNFFSVGPIGGRFPVYQPLRYTSAAPLPHSHMRRWCLQIKQVQTLDEELSSFGANLHPSPSELAGKCIFKLRKFSQQTQRVISLAEQNQAAPAASSSSSSSSSSSARSTKQQTSNETYEVVGQDVADSKPIASRKWDSVDEMPVNLMKDILKAFGEKGLSDFDREDLVKAIKELLKSKSMRSNATPDD